MYNLDETQMETVENFIKSLPETIAKGNYENWFERTKKDGRLSPHEMESFVALSHALPKEFQDFPQKFAIAVKNGTDIDGEPDTSEESYVPNENQVGKRKRVSKPKPKSKKK